MVYRRPWASGLTGDTLDGRQAQPDRHTDAPGTGRRATGEGDTAADERQRW